MPKEKPTSIEQYIQESPPKAQPHLRQMYSLLKEIAPAGTAAIKWGVPVFWEGRVIFGFAAYQAHLSFGPGEAALQHFASKLAGFKTGKGTMQLPYDQPLPADLIREIAAFCVAQTQERGD